MINYSNDQIKQYHNTLLTSHVSSHGFLHQQIASFDYFLTTGIQSITLTHGKLDFPDNPYLSAEFVKVWVEDVQITENMKTTSITPTECRLRSITYEAPLYANIKYTNNDRTYLKQRILLGSIPIMVKSKKCILNASKVNEQDIYRLKECPFDTGGYFIINGSEKAILIQEQKPTNRFLIQTDVKKNDMVELLTIGKRTKTKLTLVIRKGIVYLAHRSLDEDIPISMVLTVLGVDNDAEMYKLLGLPDHVASPNINIQYEILSNFKQKRASTNIPSPAHTSYSSMTKTDLSFEYIGSHIKGFIEEKISVNKTRTQLFITQNLLPNLEGNMGLKKLHLVYMTKLLFTKNFKDRTKRSYCLDYDDIDHIACKRYVLSGELLSFLYEDSFKRVCNEIIKGTKNKTSKLKLKDDFDPTLLIRPSIITDTFRRTLSTGKLILPRFNMKMAAITTTLPRISFLAALEVLSRVSSQLQKNSSSILPRVLKSSQWGMICPVDTPEGEAIGLVKHLALLALVTVARNITSVKEQIFLIIQSFSDNPKISFIPAEEIVQFTKGHYTLMLEGEILGQITKPMIFRKEFVKHRRLNLIPYFVNIGIRIKRQEINIYTGAGRICRALIIVENKKPLVTFNDIMDLKQGKPFIEFLEEGKVEYLDVNEEETSTIALNLNCIVSETTHLEIDSTACLGVLASLIPLSNHNQSPRNTYQCSMGKQSISYSGLNYLFRTDTCSYNLIYSQKPLIYTKTNDILDLPTGTNATLAVLSYSGYDIEDAVVLNKSSLERGFGRCTINKTETVNLDHLANGATQKLAPPDRLDKHASLDRDGLPNKGKLIRPGNVTFNKMTPIVTKEEAGDFFNSSYKYEETPCIYRGKNPTRVSDLYITSNFNEKTLFKLTTRETRIPELGDKFSSRHGQKGVVGLIVKQEDLPFTTNGIVPDIIMNPHGFPSRMTMAKILELISGKAAAMEGSRYEMSSFSHPNIENIEALLESYGYKASGKETMISGITGRKIRAQIFIGPVYYQKLKHMVGDKFHARTVGPNNSLTRQPTEGKSKEGGLRLGEMERDVLIAHGAVHFLNERMLKSSDEYFVHICSKCGGFGYDKKCISCSGEYEMKKVKMGYACKLMFQELNSMGIKVQLAVKD